MAATMTEDTTAAAAVGTAADVGRQVLSLAGDALCLAATALRLRLSALPSPPNFSGKVPQMREISLAEVSRHDDPKDCWIVIHDLVYDVTNFLNGHPGGADVMLEYAGRDASFAFRSVNHGPESEKALEKCLVGRLPANECIFGPASHNH